MKICDILRKDKIVPSLKGTTKTEVINELIDLFKDDERVTNIENMRVAVHDREKIMSTGVGKGFAIPHAKTASVTDIVAAFGKLDNPIVLSSGSSMNLISARKMRTNKPVPRKAPNLLNKNAQPVKPEFFNEIPQNFERYQRVFGAGNREPD